MSILVADIGGTNARFALVERGDSGPLTDLIVLSTSAYRDARDCLDDALIALRPDRLDAACLGVAGPVVEGCAQITNGTLRFDERELGARLDCPVWLINDFDAVSRALPNLTDLRQVGGDSARVVAPKVCLGPGTGLGVGALLPVDGRWLPVASEAAHGGIAPGSPLEAELLKLLQARFDHVCWETVLCGPGIVNLYQTVCDLWGAAPDELAPSDITARGAAMDDPVCHQTVELFCSLLGAFAGTMALTFCARGGLYIAGGIVPAFAEFVATSPLRRRFEEQGDLSEMAAGIPIYLVLDQDPGLLGARQAAHEFS